MDSVTQTINSPHHTALQVFSAAKAGAIFCFMDASYHFWAEVEGVMAGLHPTSQFEILHPRPQPWQCTNTMLAVKNKE